MNAVEKKKETKQVILEVARPLFSENGFNGTSVRLIAEKSDVNIAAINYHFGSKENLYWSIIFESYEWMDRQVEQAVRDSHSLEEVVQKLFNVLTQNGDYVLSTMRTYLSTIAPPPEAEHAMAKKMAHPESGPPGGEHLASFLKKNYPNAKNESIQWAMLAMFSTLIHLSSIVSTSFYKNVKQKYMPLKTIEKGLARTARAISRDLEADD